MIPEPTAEDLARDAESDYVTKERDCFLELRAWIRLRVAADRERDEYIRQCHEAIALANEKRDQADKLFTAKCNAEAERDDLRAERDKLQAFKDWVHAYLDGKSVPHHPPGTHGAAGCRIGDRMDWLFGQFAELRAKVEQLKAALKSVASKRQCGLCWCSTADRIWCVGQPQCKAANEAIK